jgi:hypothetical protein
MEDGSFRSAKDLQKGSRVVGADGEIVEVTVKREHFVDKLVKLHTSYASMLVSPSHRIAVPATGADDFPAMRPHSYKLARDCKNGDQVLCDGWEVQTLVHVEGVNGKTLVWEIAFKPDNPIAAFMPPPGKILTKGTRIGTRNRRSGMNKRGRGRRVLEDTVSIPDTAGGLTE